MFLVALFLFLLFVGVSVFFFFFQAEDGIRDGHVTGIQTCALPIYLTRAELARLLDEVGPAVRVARRHRAADLRSGRSALGRPGARRRDTAPAGAPRNRQGRARRTQVTSRRAA